MIPKIPEKKEKATFFSASEKVERVRRNLIVFSFTGIVFWYFDIKIRGVSYLGISSEVVSTDVVFKIMISLIVYEVVHYAIRLHSEYAEYLSVKEKNDTFYVGELYRNVSQGSVTVNEAGVFWEHTPSEMVEKAVEKFRVAKKWSTIRFAVCEVFIPTIMSATGIIVSCFAMAKY